MDNKIKCSKCGEEFLSSEKTEHDFRCGYAFDIKDYENLIPCEFCNNLIDITDYQQHVSVCSSPQSIFMRSLNDTLPPPSMNINEFPFLQNINNMLNNIPEPEPANLGQGLDHNVNVNNNNQNINDELDVDVDVDVDLGVDVDVDVEEGENNNLDEGLLLDQNNLEESFVNLFQNNGDNIAPENVEQMLTNIFTSIFNQNQDLDLINNNLNNLNNLSDEYEELTALGENIGDVEIGVSDINSVSKLEFKEIECPICSDTKKLIRITKCNHEFCSECLKEWLNTNKKCPICMVELE